MANSKISQPSAVHPTVGEDILDLEAWEGLEPTLVKELRREAANRGV